MQVIPAATAAAISPKLEMAWMAPGAADAPDEAGQPEQGHDGHGRALDQEAALGG